MEEIVNYLLQSVPGEYAIYVSLLCTVCGIISTFWKIPAEDANIFVKAIYKLVNILGMNWGKAQNADDKADADKKAAAASAALSANCKQ